MPSGAHGGRVTGRRAVLDELAGERIDPSEIAFPGIRPRSRLSIVRPDDLLVVAFEFRHLSVAVENTDAGPLGILRPTGGSEQAFLIVHLQPQNIAERAFFETPPASNELIPQGKVELINGQKVEVIKDRDKLPGADPEQPSANSLPVPTLIAGPSRLVFKVPADAAIRYTVAGILDAIRSLELNVPATALPPQPDFDIFRPYWVGELTQVLAKASSGGLTPIERTRAKGRLQRWQDVSDLVPVTMRGRAGFIPRSEVVRIGVPTIEGDVIGGSDGSVRNVVEVLDPNRILEMVRWLRRHPRLAEPRDTETALELPFRLYLSPNSCGAWAHAPDPVTSPKTARTELWHTRLATRKETEKGLDIVEDDDPLRTVRAVWARSGSDPADPAQAFDPDPANRPLPSHANKPFRMSLDPSDRFEIVHLSANFNVPKAPGKRSYRPRPIDVNRLMLASLGAWVDSRGAWEPPKLFEVEEWRHRGTMARDHYVRVVYKGYLWPFGHRASVIKITERKLHPSIAGNPAILRQRMYIIVRQPALTYGDPKLMNPSGHLYDYQFPFTQVRITSLVTPNLDPPEQTDYPRTTFATSSPLSSLAGGEAQSLFWPHVGSAPFPFHLVAEDLEGRRVEFTAPLLFVSNIHALNATILGGIKDHYESTVAATLGTVRLSGQRVALAPPAEPGDTMFEAEALELGVEIPDDANLSRLGADRPRFYPRVRNARIVVPVVKQFTGNEQSTLMSFAPEFLKSGLPEPGAGPGHPNDGQVFLAMAASPIALDFSGGGDKAGAFVQPNFDVSGLSRSLGPVGGNLAALATGTFTPADFFDAMKARLFGVVDLGELIQAAGVNTPDLVPKFVTEAVAAMDTFTRELARLESTVTALRTEAAGAAGIPAAVKAQVVTLEADIQARVGEVVSAIDAFLAGTDATPQLIAAVTAMSANLTSAKALLGTIGPLVAADVRQSVQAIVDSILGEIGDGVAAITAFADRLRQALQLAEELTMRFDWKPNVQHWPDPGNEQDSIFRARNTKSGDTTTFSIAAEIQAKTKLRPEPRYDIACRLHNFTLNLIGEQSFILLHFNKLEFTSKSGSKPDVNVEFDDIEFTGVLSFVEALRTLIPLDGFSDPPALQVSEKGISASYSMALPDIAVGVFTLQNLSLGAGFNVPFLLDPLTVRFNFCERESPFLLTVSAFGGGGFFAITLDPDGVEILEASFEFGASLSVNLGVASGGVTVMAGIYYKMEVDEATLTGYFRMAGEVDVLGLISACIELYLGLTYEFASGKCAGKATITVEVSVAFFSTDVSVSCERKFAGSNGDPTFAQLMGPDPAFPGDPWAKYCEAFA